MVIGLKKTLKKSNKSTTGNGSQSQQQHHQVQNQMKTKKEKSKRLHSQAELKREKAEAVAAAKRRLTDIPYGMQMQFIHDNEIPSTSRGQTTASTKTPFYNSKLISNAWKNIEKASKVPLNYSTKRRCSPTWLQMSSVPVSLKEAMGFVQPEPQSSRRRPDKLYSDVVFGAGSSCLVKVKTVTAKTGSTVLTASTSTSASSSSSSSSTPPSSASSRSSTPPTPKSTITKIRTIKNINNEKKNEINNNISTDDDNTSGDNNSIENIYNKEDTDDSDEKEKQSVYFPILNDFILSPPSSTNSISERNHIEFDFDMTDKLVDDELDDLMITANDNKSLSYCSITSKTDIPFEQFKNELEEAISGITENDDTTSLIDNSIHNNILANTNSNNNINRELIPGETIRANGNKKRYIGLDIPMWNFVDLNELLHYNFPKFLYQYNDENYLKAEKMALLGLKLALGSHPQQGRFKF